MHTDPFESYRKAFEKIHQEIADPKQLTARRVAGLRTRALRCRISFASRETTLPTFYSTVQVWYYVIEVLPRRAESVQASTRRKK